MSNQNYYGSQPPPGNNNSYHQGNPWQEEEGTLPQGYSTNPPPQQGSMQQPLQPQRRTEQQAEDFVPEAERSEQMETMQQYELSKGPDSKEDQDVEMLQREFPGVDGSLVAALYGDTKDTGATREMLQELANS